jgi:adenosylcobinamide-GDP ribazoletransferase
MIKHFAIALSFLTLFRLPGSARITVTPVDLARSFSYYPLVGFLLGACWFGIAFFLHTLMPAPVLATLLTALMALMTRGLHLDGLADLTDGLGGGYTRERRLEIMKDSSIGTFGAAALILILAFKIAALSTLIPARAWSMLFLTPALSRYAMVLASYKSIYARAEGGLGKAVCDHINTRQLMTATVVTALLCLMLAPFRGVFLILTLMACVLLMRFLSRRWLGGITGDVLGAINEITEAVLLSVAACLSSQ